MINDLLVLRKPIKSVQGKKKEEMLIPGWNSYDIIFEEIEQFERYCNYGKNLALEQCQYSDR